MTDFDNETAAVDIDADLDSCKISLVSYVAPCPIGFTPATGDQQFLYDSITKTLPVTNMSVDIPTADDIDALCDEATDSTI